MFLWHFNRNILGECSLRDEYVPHKIFDCYNFMKCDKFYLLSIIWEDGDDNEDDDDPRVTFS